MRTYMCMQMLRMKVREFLTKENGDTNIIAIVLIMVVVVGLAVVFRENITSLITKMWTKITTDATPFTGE